MVVEHSSISTIENEIVVGRTNKVTRVSERLMMVKLIVGMCLMNAVAAYAPQTGRSQKEKDNFWEAVWKLIEGIKKTERIMLGGDLSGHVGKESDGYEGGTWWARIWSEECRR